MKIMKYAKGNVTTQKSDNHNVVDCSSSSNLFWYNW